MAFSGKDSRARSRQRAFRRSAGAAEACHADTTRWMVWPVSSEPVLALEPDPTEGAAHFTVDVGHPERHAAREERPVQLCEQFGACEIDPRHDAKIKDDEPDSIPPSGEELEQPLAHVFDVEVQQGRLTANHEDAGRRVVFRMAHPIGEVGRVGDPCQLGDAGLGGLPQQQYD